MRIIGPLGCGLLLACAPSCASSGPAHAFDAAVAADAAGVADAAAPTPDARPSADAALSCASSLFGWQRLGGALSALPGATNASRPAVAVGGDGEPIVAWAEGSPLDIHVMRWTGSQWQPMGGALSAVGGSTPASAPVLAVRGDEIVVAWIETDGSTPHPYAAGWTGSTWSPLGGAVSSGRVQSLFMSLVLEQDRTPVLAWDQVDGVKTNIHVAEWNGTTWVGLGGALRADPTSTASALLPTLALDDNDNPVVAWQEPDANAGFTNAVWVRRWNGIAWDSYAGGSVGAVAGMTPAFAPHLDPATGSAPVMAWSENNKISTAVYVQHWNGTSWDAWGTALGATGGATNSTARGVAVDSSGRAVVVWTEPDATGVGRVYAYRRSGGVFAPLGSGVLDIGGNNTGGRLPALAMDRCDRPIVAWQESDGTAQNIYVATYY